MICRAVGLIVLRRQRKGRRSESQEVDEEGFIEPFPVMRDEAALGLAALLYLALPLFEASPWAFITLYVAASLLLSVTMTAIFAMASISATLPRGLEIVSQKTSFVFSVIAFLKFSGLSGSTNVVS